jgi:hypothetical protein
MGTDDPFPGGKTRPGRDADHSPSSPGRDADHSPSSSTEVKNEELDFLSPLPPAWRSETARVTQLFSEVFLSRARRQIHD